MEKNGLTIMIVGCGPGSLDYLTPLARQTIERAEVVVGASRLLDLFPRHQAERIVVGADIEKVLDEIDVRRHSKRVVVLVSGDPGLCSLAQPVLKRFGRHACEVIPGISSLQVAFARIGLDWLDARIIDAHDENPDIEPASLAKDEKIAILTGGTRSMEWMAGLVPVFGESHRIYICENLTLKDEQIRQIEAADLSTLDISSRTIILLIKKDELS